MNGPYRLILDLVLVLLAIVALAFGVRQVLSWRSAAIANAATAQQLSQTATATSGVTAAAGVQQQKAQQLDITVSQARGAYEQRYEELKHEDPSVNAFAGYAIPDSLRDAARARRLARDGPSGDAAGRSRHDAGADSGGTDPASGPSQQR